MVAVSVENSIDKTVLTRSQIRKALPSLAIGKSALEKFLNPHTGLSVAPSRGKDALGAWSTRRPRPPRTASGVLRDSEGDRHNELRS